MSATISGPRLISYGFFVLVLFVIARFDLGAGVMSGLVSYMIMDVTERSLRARGARRLLARWAALAAFAIMATVLAWIFITFLRVGMVRLPVLLDTVLPRLASFAERYGMDFPADNARELRDLVVAAAKENSSSIGKTSGLLTRGFFQIIIGVFAAMMRFLSPAPAAHGGNLADSLRLEINARVTRFMRSFERVVGAQVVISAFNTVLTAAFLYAMDFHFKTFLILTTFVFGLIPIVGNVISNTCIVASGLIASEQMAMFGLVYLVIIHKLEYLLNSRIMGESIGTPMWITLIGLVVGEALMGVPGVLLAPALLHYVREELRTIPAKA
jgi:predicted PurR-regulated permease PerM